MHLGNTERPVDTKVAREIVRFHGIAPSRSMARKGPELYGNWQESLLGRTERL